MLELKFTTRQGGHENFERGLVLTDDAGREQLFYLLMRTEGEGGSKTRVGTIWPAARNAKGELVALHADPVWTGELPEGPPPTRAFAVAAGLCDENGKTDIPLPNWAQ